MAKNLFNVEFEKQFLSSLVLNPHEVWSETNHFISDKDLSAGHKPVFQIVRNLIENGQEINKYIIAQSLINLNIKIFDVMNPEKYVLEVLTILDIDIKTGIQAAKEIKKYSIKRELVETGLKIQKIAESDENRKIIDIVNECNNIFSKKINVLSAGNGLEPQDLFGTAESNIENEEGIGSKNDIIPPYELYQDMFGDFDAGGLHVFCSRMGVGKSTWLMNILEQCILRDDDCIALLLDTELENERVQRRMISSLSGINEYFIKNKSYKRNKEMYDKVKAAFERIKPLKGRLDHTYIGGIDLQTQLSICRTWYQKNVVGRNKRAIIALDYFKLGSVDNYDTSLKDYQLLGLKADSYKQLATELQLPVLAAVQTNRNNEKTNFGQKIENTAVVAGSDEIARFCSNMFLLQRLTVDEKASYNTEADLSLKSLKTRQLGPDLKNLNTLVKYEGSSGKIRYSENFLLYSAKNFKIEEICSFADIVKKNKLVDISITSDKSNGPTF